MVKLGPLGLPPDHCHLCDLELHHQLHSCCSRSILAVGRAVGWLNEAFSLCLSVCACAVLPGSLGSFLTTQLGPTIPGHCPAACNLSIAPPPCPVCLSPCPVVSQAVVIFFTCSPSVVDILFLPLFLSPYFLIHQFRFRSSSSADTFTCRAIIGILVGTERCIFGTPFNSGATFDWLDGWLDDDCLFHVESSLR